ncbi:putative quinol monooxygenase [Metabacillus sediminilitoris]|uniref:Antibiotic biosynthesis monooxygenase n=1 Tax=Metabacillus sediminilitoris TaxID=2567941 RepID=A0A4S4BQJ4_9BACI|nr:putative quinol monooxygenase [Metabacillus sediminilitoris]QGQ45676.1 antibiotic biosynthesis monooxygenase [Metabacillus sediminilitoris]THF77205.1 antibiotic biosynthesis monooxygenase [Metabacillus sediminilitoris]
MSEIIINAVLKAKPGKGELLRTELLNIIEASRAEDSCLQYTLHESVENNDTFVFYERWKDEKALATHIETDHYKHYRQQTEQLLEKRDVYRLQIITP